MHDTPPRHLTPSATSVHTSALLELRAATSVVDAGRCSTTRPTQEDTQRDRRRRELRFRAYLTVAVFCAVSAPLTVFVAAPYLDEGLFSALIACVISVLMGLAVYFSGVATDAAHRLK